VQTIFEMKEEDQDSSGVHFGGRMAFDPEDNSIYLTIGERRNISRAQDPTDKAGSVLRMTDEGEPHPDGPFVHAEEDGEDADEYVFTWGHRNPQSIGFHPETGELWLADHGPKGGDEINLLEAGNNYGWPFITGGVDYSGAPIGVQDLEHPGVVSPVNVFDETVAPSGMAFVTGDLFTEWQGDMIIGGLAAEGVVRLSIAEGEVVDEEWIEIGRRIRDVQLHEDGSLWLLTEHEDGEVLRLIPRGS
jgi:aldose sugar dehydrogenase